jgi:multidrug efflux system outer membrane protein
MRKTCLSATLGLLLAGCSFTPHYVRPASPVSAQWPDRLKDVATPSPASAGEGATAPVAADIAWEDFYRSPQLRAVIAQGLANNRDLRKAALNVEAYRAQYRIAHADLMPTLNAGGAPRSSGCRATCRRPGRRGCSSNMVRRWASRPMNSTCSGVSAA